MSSRWTGFFLWALIALSAAFWGLQLFAASRALPAGAQMPQRTVAAGGPLVRLFGAVAEADPGDDEPAAASERFKLLGVIAPPAGRGGLALISIDDQPAKAWFVGAPVDGETLLLAVGRRTADLGPRGGPAAFTIELPLPLAAATGSLPAAGAAGARPVLSPGGAVRPMPLRPGFVPGQPQAQGFPAPQGIPFAGRGPNGAVQGPGANIRPGLQPGQVPPPTEATGASREDE